MDAVGLIGEIRAQPRRGPERDRIRPAAAEAGGERTVQPGTSSSRAEAGRWRGNRTRLRLAVEASQRNPRAEFRPAGRWRPRRGRRPSARPTNSSLGPALFGAARLPSGYKLRHDGAVLFGATDGAADTTVRFRKQNTRTAAVNRFRHRRRPQRRLSRVSAATSGTRRTSPVAIGALNWRCRARARGGYRQYR